jgi:hypothetical protein
MHRALPSSEYYGGSAPAPDRSADDVLSPHHHAGHAAGGQARDGSRVHCDSLTEGGARLCPSGLAASTPQTFPAASQSPASRLLGVPHQVGARRSRPRSARFEPVRALRGFMTPVPHVLLSGLLTGPTPSDGAGAPRLCQDCSHQPQRLPGASCPQLLPGSLRRPSGGGLSPPLESAAPHGARNKPSRRSRPTSTAGSPPHENRHDHLHRRSDAPFWAADGSVSGVGRRALIIQFWAPSPRRAGRALEWRTACGGPRSCRACPGRLGKGQQRWLPGGVRADRQGRGRAGAVAAGHRQHAGGSAVAHLRLVCCLMVSRYIALSCW